MSKTASQDRELQDSELDLVSGGTDAAVSQVLSEAFSNVLKASFAGDGLGSAHSVGAR